MNLFLGRFGRLASVFILLAVLSACDNNHNNPILPDTAAPTLISTSPVDGATDVAVDVSISSTLSETLDAATVGPGRLTVTATGGGAVTGTVSLAGAVVTFTPDVDLADATGYTATLDAKVADVAGNPLGTDATWTFTTVAGDSTPPTVSARNPANTATDVVTSTTVSIELDEALDPATVTAGVLMLVNGGNVAGTVSLSNGDQTITFTPGAALAAGTNYTATLAGTVTDVAGNALGADDVWSFTTAGTAASTASVVYTINGPTRSLRRADIDNQNVIANDTLSDPGWTDSVDGTRFAISPDGTRVAMLAQADGASLRELYVAPVAGGIPVKLSGILVPNIAVQDFEWSPDSTQIAYLASAEFVFSDDLYVVSADGGATEVKVNPALVAGGRVASFQWSPDGSLIAYAVDRFVQADWRLVISTPDGAVDTVVPKLGGYPVRPGTGRMAWSPDSSRIAYMVRLLADEKMVIVGADGLLPTYLSTPVLTNSSKITWAPDGSTVAAILLTDGNNQLVVSPADGSPFTAATTTLSGRVRSLAWAPDSSLIAYTYNPNGSFALFVDAPGGNSLVEVSAVLSATNAGVGDFSWSPDSGTLLLAADPQGLVQANLYTVSRTGTNLVQLTNRMGSNLFTAVFSPDGSMVYAVGSVGLQTVVSSVALDGSGEALAIDPLLTGSVDGFQVVDSAGISRVVAID